MRVDFYLFNSSIAFATSMFRSFIWLAFVIGNNSLVMLIRYSPGWFPSLPAFHSSRVLRPVQFLKERMDSSGVCSFALFFITMLVLAIIRAMASVFFKFLHRLYDRLA